MKRIIHFLFIFILIISLSILSLYGVGYVLKKPALLKENQITLYDNQNQEFYSSSITSKSIELKDISQYFIQSIIAIEDHRFYNHFGFDPFGISRAIYSNILKGKKSQGASTISQQYARLLYLSNEKTWSRKIKEAFLTIRLETHYNKETILKGYINTVYYGHGIYGIYDAAHFYFNKEPSQLDLNESSLLAGVINGPQYYSPFINMNNAKNRQKKVLDKLVQYQYITQNQADTVLKTPFQLNDKHSNNTLTNTSFYKDTVIKELKELGFYNEKLIQKGLHVETSLDMHVQTKLNETIMKQMKDKEELEVSSMILDSKHGSVLALVGGKDYSSSQFNRATKASRQVASTMKPLLYYIALENGFTPTTKFKSEATTFQLENGQTYSPTNFNSKYAHQDITLAQAICVSDNIYAVKTHMFLGEQALCELLKKFNYTHISPHPSLALGTLNTNIYDFSNIYTTFANTGIYNKTHAILKVYTSDGNILYTYKDQNKQLLSKTSCLILNQMLSQTSNSKLSSYASPTMSSYPTNTSFSIKTGTSPYDSLCFGYNPNYTIMSWSGYDDNRKLTMSLDKKVPKVIFQTMANYLQDDDIWYTPTSSIKKIPINPLTGNYDPQGIIYWFKTE